MTDIKRELGPWEFEHLRPVYDFHEREQRRQDSNEVPQSARLAARFLRDNAEMLTTDWMLFPQAHSGTWAFSFDPPPRRRYRRWASVAEWRRGRGS